MEEEDVQRVCLSELPMVGFPLYRLALQDLFNSTPRTDERREGEEGDGWGVCRETETERTEREREALADRGRR